MMYQITYLNKSVYGPDEENCILEPKLDEELNSAGTFTFTIPVENEFLWNNIEVFKGEIIIYEEDDIIWFGRPFQIVRDWYNRKVVTCEGALSYFNDTVQATHTYDKLPLYTDPDVQSGKKGFFNTIIDLHNDMIRMDEYDFSRQIFVGNITIDNESNIYREVDYQTTAEILQQMCLETNGGYFILRKALDPEDGNVKNYIDWVKEMPYGTTQKITFGRNLLDVNQDLNGADICTVLLAFGNDDKTVSGLSKWTKNKTHYVMPNGNELYHDGEYIYHIQGYEKYGRVLKVKTWNDIIASDSSGKEQLFIKAAEWLDDQNTEVTTIECDAADLHYIDTDEIDDQGKLRIGQKVTVLSPMHDINGKELPIFKISMALDSGAKKITMGTPPKRELTDIVKSSGSSTRGSSGTTGGGSSDGSSGGSGSVNIPVKDVQVKMPGEDKFKTVVKKKVAKLDLSELIGGVSDVTLDGSSIVNEGVAELSTSDIVEGNPEDQATEALEALKIGDTVYGIPVPPVVDVQVDDVSVVDANGVAKLQSPSIPVIDVQVDDVSIVDENGVANLDSSEFGTHVEANPQRTGYVNLLKILIGNTVYNIPSGSGSTNVLYGTEDPPSNLGNDGDIYFRIINNGSVDIFGTPESVSPENGYIECDIPRNQQYLDYYEYCAFGDNKGFGINGYSSANIDYILNGDITYKPTHIEFYDNFTVQGGWLGCSPVVLLGSNDGITWDTIYTKSSGQEARDVKFVTDITCNNYYSRFRISITAFGGYNGIKGVKLIGVMNGVEDPCVRAIFYKNEGVWLLYGMEDPITDVRVDNVSVINSSGVADIQTNDMPFVKNVYLDGESILDDSDKIAKILTSEIIEHSLPVLDTYEKKIINQSTEPSSDDGITTDIVMQTEGNPVELLFTGNDRELITNSQSLTAYHLTQDVYVDPQPWGDGYDPAERTHQYADIAWGDPSDGNRSATFLYTNIYNDPEEDDKLSPYSQHLSNVSAYGYAYSTSFGSVIFEKHFTNKTYKPAYISGIFRFNGAIESAESHEKAQYFNGADPSCAVSNDGITWLPVALVRHGDIQEWNSVLTYTVDWSQSIAPEGFYSYIRVAPSTNGYNLGYGEFSVYGVPDDFGIKDLWYKPNDYTYIPLSFAIKNKVAGYLYDACVANGVTPSSHDLNDIIATFLM